MLDTKGIRFDVAKLVRLARSTPTRAVNWRGYRVDFDEGNELLLIEDLEVELERVPTRLPTGRVVPGAMLARCPRGCGRRGRVLWVDPADVQLFLVCRECAEIEYATSKTGSEAERARLALRRAGQRLHDRGNSDRARTRRGYRRDAQRLESARLRVERAETGELCSIIRQLGWLPPARA